MKTLSEQRSHPSSLEIISNGASNSTRFLLMLIQPLHRPVNPVSHSSRLLPPKMEKGGSEREVPIFRDIRRYYCKYCGICRSKKSLITSHVLSHHQDKIEDNDGVDGNGEKKEVKSNNTCEQCGTSFQKPAHLRQHMLSHSIEHWIPNKELQNARGSSLFLEWISTRQGDLLRSSIKPFTCPLDDCNSSYRRKDHLTRHLLQHQGKLFECPVENCNSRFAFQGNMKRHVKEFHEEESSSSNGDNGPKQYICQEIGCGKEFKYASKLRKHEASHVELVTVETFCSEPGCMKNFTNLQCLKAHLQSCHRHITCEVCGTKQLKKNIKRHLRTHEAGCSSERINCNFKGCQHTFSTRSNLHQHEKAVHLELRRFACSITGCGMRFTFKHVRDKHEKSGCHVYTYGDFEESDEQFRSIPRGGQKRKCPTIETLTRKRVCPPSESDSIMNQGPDYLSWLLSTEAEDDGQQ
ncbi:unnamed protein product [Camellia sinensis]